MSLEIKKCLLDFEQNHFLSSLKSLLDIKSSLDILKERLLADDADLEPGKLLRVLHGLLKDLVGHMELILMLVVLILRILQQTVHFRYQQRLHKLITKLSHEQSRK